MKFINNTSHVFLTIPGFVFRIAFLLKAKCHQQYHDLQLFTKESDIFLSIPGSIFYIAFLLNAISLVLYIKKIIKGRKNCDIFM